MPTKSKLVPMVVTTEHKGVFFGHGIKSDSKTIELKDAQMCVYWSSDTHGLPGLAANGPSSHCRVSPPVPVMVLQDVTGVFVCTDKAVKAWEIQPWG